MPELPDPKNRALMLRQTIEGRRTDFEKLLSSFLPAQRERYFQVLLTALRDPNIQSCTPVSIIDSMLKSAQWGLPVDGTHAALVAYKDTCTFIPMYRGMMEVCRRSGQIKQVWADVVLDGEYIEVEGGSEPKLKHSPEVLMDRTDHEKVVAAYAVAKWGEGGVQFAVLSRAELDKARAASRAQSPYAPWAKWTTEMMKKTAVRRLMKMLPLGAEISALLDEDEQLEMDLSSQRPAQRSRPKTLDDLGVAPPQALAETAGEPAATFEEPVVVPVQEAVPVHPKARAKPKQPDLINNPPEEEGSDWPRR